MSDKTLLQRMHAVMQEVSYVTKDSMFKAGGKDIPAVSHDGVCAALRPSIVDHGIVVTASVVGHSIVAEWDVPNSRGGTTHYTNTAANVDVTFWNIDDQEDKITVTGLGHGIDNADKGPGKAISYTVKMALLKCFFLETGTRYTYFTQ